jgi:ATP phosphoribosyltransferase
MVDLEDVAALFHARRGRRMRVATKYVALTRRFFAEHGVSDYRIVESLGATEGAPAAGTAELIVDITTTGATLQANALKVLDDGVMLRSEANLVASLRAPWSERHVATARAILSRIAAEETARQSRDVVAEMDQPGESVLAAAFEEFGARALARRGAGQVVFRCRDKMAAGLATWLIDQGASHVAVTGHEYLFAAENPLFDALMRRLPPAAVRS